MPAQRFAAFLRAVNVGGHNKTPMVELRALFEKLGYADVATYVQSGNVAFTAKAAPDPMKLEAAFAKQFGFASTMIVRTRAQLATLAHPFLADEPDHAKIHVVFLAGDPTKQIKPSPPDRHVVVGREIFVHYRDGAGKTKLKLDAGVPGTARNWRSVLSVLALLDAV